MYIFETFWAISIVFIVAGTIIFRRNQPVDGKITWARDAGSFLIAAGIVLGFYTSLLFLHECWNAWVDLRAFESS
jgi:hypothetical protein